MLSAILVFAGLAAAQFPTTAPSGAVSQVRIFNQFDAASGNTVLSDGTTVYAGNAAVVATLTKGAGVTATTQVLTSTPGFGQFQDVDLTDLTTAGQIAQQATISFTQGTGGPVLCPAIPVTANQRITVTLTSTITDQPQTGTCQNGATVLGGCTVVNQRTIVFTCTATAATAQDQRECDDFTFNLVRADALTCPLRVARTNAAISGVQATESVLLNELFNTASTTIDLSRSSDYAFEASATAIPNNALSTEAFVSSTGTIDVRTDDSGYLNIVNAAHRTYVPTGQVNKILDESFTFVIRRAGAAAAPAQVVHFSTSPVTTATPAGWLQLPTGSYSVDVYSGDNTQTNIFATPQTIVGPAAVTATVQIGSAESKILVIQGNGIGVSTETITITEIDATPPANTIAAGATQFTVYNFVNGVSLDIAKADTTSCFILNGNTGLTTGQSVSVSSTFLDSTVGSRSFDVYESTATCGALGKDRGDVSLTDISGFSNANGQCGHRIVLLTGRPYLANNLPVVGTGTCTGCVTSETRIGNLQFIDSAGTTDQVGVIATGLDVPSCSCTAAAVCTDTINCKLQAEFDAIESQLSTLVGAVSAVQGSLPADTSGAIGNVLTAVNAQAALELRTQALVRDNGGEIEEVLDEIDDLIDEVDDAIDAADDAEDEAADATKLSKDSLKIINKVLNRVKVIRDAVVVTPNP